MNRMVFDVSTLGYIQKTQSIILDYEIVIKDLKKSDRIFEAGALGNFSLAGFEMVRKRKYYIKGVSEKTSRFDFCISRLSVQFVLTSQETY